MTSEHSSQRAPGDIFATTHWTVVLAAGKRSTRSPTARWRNFAAPTGFRSTPMCDVAATPKEDAEDLTQAFFARFLEKNYLAGLGAERGRFRAFLLAS